MIHRKTTLVFALGGKQTNGIETKTRLSFHPIRIYASIRPTSPRISISSLLTVDQATIAAHVSQQSLNTYIPNYYHSSPLEDPLLFYAFRHFVEVVAPTMSLIESSPPNPSILNHHAIPNMKACNLFTYQLPVMAVSGNGAIMEAILAISFLHLSHVTRSSKQQAFSHYQRADKTITDRVVKDLCGEGFGITFCNTSSRVV